MQAGALVPVTMCNGQTANNTINTCNGKDCVGYLEKHGQSGTRAIVKGTIVTAVHRGTTNRARAPS